MTSRNKTARTAGLIYLMLVISGLIYLVYIPGQLIVRDSASITFENISNSEFLFRLGIVTAIFSSLVFTSLSLILYKLLHKVNETHAIFMVLFVLLSIPISFVNILNKFSVLDLINVAESAQIFSEAELHNQVMFQLGNYSNGVEISQIFWGLWLFPFGYLVYKSGFLPQFLGIFLMAGCFGYLISFFGGFLFSDFNKTLISEFIGIPAAIGEIGTCLWLLIMGANKINLGTKVGNKS